MGISQAPALVAWGCNDQFVPPEGAQAYLEDLRDAELHLVHTGHFVTVTHNEKLAELIGAFLERRVMTSARRS
jgi:pimeloyl-ACP methyl ester carboxylesterase